MNKKNKTITIIIIAVSTILLLGGPLLLIVINNSSPKETTAEYYDAEEEQLLVDEYTDLMKLYVNLDEEMTVSDTKHVIEEVAPAAKIELNNSVGKITQGNANEYISFEIIGFNYTNFVYHNHDRYITEISNGIFVFFNGQLSNEYETKDGAIVDLLLML
ncbi:hypothetical protein IKP94_01500 [Candidatus Saccharibacteria bacterium]|nr:hypothetical protein [Candidatus Saccharibacteria bacterium]